jgi:hypothetical protein
MSMWTSNERERVVGRGRRTRWLRALAGVLYFTVGVQLVGGFQIPPDGPIPGAVSLAGMASGVCAIALILFARPWAGRPDEDLDGDALEARRTAQLRGFGLVAVASLALLGAAMLAAAFGDFTAGAEHFTPWLLGLVMLSLGGPSAALPWTADQG